jgi:hypothetical protein
MNPSEFEPQTGTVVSPDFYAGEWRTDCKGRRFRVCYELVEGRWGGFVALAR